jgi:hypothetical protein
MREPCYPALYQINTRVWLTGLARALGQPATLDDIPDAELDRLARMGFDWLWFLSVWQTGPAGRQVSRSNLAWRREFEATLPDLTEEDIVGSGFAITGYTVSPGLGGEAALARLRARLQARGLRLMLDFVPNHTALDHPWVREHPEYYVPGTAEQLGREPQNYCRLDLPGGPRILAYGRDPYFPGWPDALQLNYAEPGLQAAMAGELLRIAGMCDGVRCDMAMLLLPEVFERTWGLRPEPFWPSAIAGVRARHPDFLFMAEVYWDLEWTLQQQGFDYTYDKRLYDRLRAQQARPVREHFAAEADYQRRSARFLENHDEPRAAATFPPAVHRAAAVLTFLCPGLRFLHQGQCEGKRIHIPVHLVRGPAEPPDAELQAFYAALLRCVADPVTREGDWQLLQCRPAWDGNWTWDGFICFAWQGVGDRLLLVAVNYAGNQGQCYVRLPFDDLFGHPVRLQDRLSSAVYDRNGEDLLLPGLYLDLPPWGHHVFEVTRTA